MALVHTVVRPGPRTSVALDRQNRMLVVQAERAEVEAIRDLVTALEQPPKLTTVTCYFLRGRMGQEGEPTTHDIPEPLKPAVAALTKAGLHSLTVLAPIIINAEDGAHFETSSSLSKLRAGEAYFSFHISGRADVGTDDTVGLTINARVDGSSENRSGRIFSADTTIATKTGSYVVLAAAPSTLQEDAFIAMITRVDVTE
jgi:hypothetical protein